MVRLIPIKVKSFYGLTLGTRMEFFMAYIGIESFMMQAASSKQRYPVFLLTDVGDGIISSIPINKGQKKCVN
jgi:hypothetical protein